MPTPTVPALISLFNRASLLGNGAPAANTFLQSDELIAKAEQRENLHNWGDEYFSTALAQLTESVRNEGRLSPFGRFAFRNFMLENLTKRLRIIEVIRRFPEITEIPINAPAFITGWYRTGTTYLHNLVTDNADVRAPLFWELRDPCPSLDPKNYPQAKSIRKTIWVERIQRYISPGFQKAHPLTAERPDECLHLFENSAFSSMAFFLTEAKSYAWWLLEQDNRPAYAFYKQQLQLLQWLRPGGQWVLKWPYHLWHLDALFDVFPDARVIHLHRDPVQAVPSVCNLSVLARQSFCEAIDHHALGQFWLDYCEAGLQRSLRQQKNVLHIEYGELVEQPQAALEAIFKFTALDGKKITPPEKSNKQTANSSASRYSLEKFGLTPTDVKQKMKEY